MSGRDEQKLNATLMALALLLTCPGLMNMDTGLLVCMEGTTYIA
ncbi:hypothetical protein MY1884_001735 [Beauveria asiatica]